MSKTFFILQDGADFYLHHDESCEDFHTVLTAPVKVRDFDLTLALRARQWFESTMREAGFKFKYVNPFASKPKSQPKSVRQGYTGQPDSPVTRMVNMSAYTGDDVEF